MHLYYIKKIKIDNNIYINHIEDLEGNKYILAKDIALINNKETKHVNENIKKIYFSKKEMLDIKKYNMVEDLITNNIFTQNAINRSNEIFLFNVNGFVKYINNNQCNANLVQKVLDVYFNSKKNFIILNNRKEITFRNSIEDCFRDIIKIIPQYQVGKYRIDIYIPEYNIAIEYDEKHHNYKTKEDFTRQKYIEKKIGCRFIRINENIKFEYAINQILKLMLKPVNSFNVNVI